LKRQLREANSSGVLVSRIRIFYPFQQHEGRICATKNGPPGGALVIYALRHTAAWGTSSFALEFGMKWRSGTVIGYFT
jgi:hypothetical protein